MMRLGMCLVLAGCWHEPAPATTPSEVPLVTIDPGPPSPSRGPMHATDSPYREVAGTWRGIGFQYDSRTQWDIEMTLFARGNVGDVIGSIAYEHGNCTAELIRQSERGDTLVMTENLVTGQGKCVDHGTIRIPRRPSGHDMDWRWDFASGVEGASSTVRRD